MKKLLQSIKDVFMKKKPNPGVVTGKVVLSDAQKNNPPEVKKAPKKRNPVIKKK